MSKTLVKKRARELSHDLSNDIEKIKEALAGASQEIRDRASELLNQTIENAREKSNAIEETINEYVNNNTYKSLGFALLTGALLGFFVGK